MTAINIEVATRAVELLAKENLVWMHFKRQLSVLYMKHYLTITVL